MTDDNTQGVAARHTAGYTRFGAADRHCRYCHEIGLAFDPAAGRPRCRCCGELA